MKKGLLKKMVVLMVILAVLFVCGASFAADTKKDQSGKFTQGKQGQAKEALEQSAGKKANDVKVPDVPPPTKVGK